MSTRDGGRSAGLACDGGTRLGWAMEVSEEEGDLLHLKLFIREFPGSPVVRPPRFQCRGHGFNPWTGN